MPIRTLARTCAASVVVAAALLPSSAAYASAPGDNGTVKIHDAKTGQALERNEPRVCTFYLDAFGFDSGQQVNWNIVQWPPTGTKGKTADSGAITLDSKGHGRTQDQSLPDGHYKLYWKFNLEKGSAKYKTFWVDCAGQGGPGPSGSPSAPPGGSTGPGGGGPTSGGGGSTSGGGGSQPTGSTSGSGGSQSTGGGHLAETGAADVTGATGAALLLIGTGGAVTLAMRRRERRQH